MTIPAAIIWNQGCLRPWVEVKWVYPKAAIAHNRGAQRVNEEDTTGMHTDLKALTQEYYTISETLRPRS